MWLRFSACGGRRESRYFPAASKAHSRRHPAAPVSLQNYRAVDRRGSAPWLRKVFLPHPPSAGVTDVLGLPGGQFR